MFEMKNFVGDNKDIIEIVSSDSAMGALKNAGINNIRVCLPLILSFGDLSDMNEYSRDSLKKLYKSFQYIPFEKGFNFQREIELLKEYVKDAKMIRVWSSHLNCDEYCLLLYICSLFPDREIRVVFSEEVSWYCMSIGMSSKGEIEELLKREHILSKQEKEDYASKWKKINLDNTDLRYLYNGEVQSVSIDFFDEEILAYLHKYNEIKLTEFIGVLMGNNVIGDTGDLLYRYLINRLIEQGKIDLRIENDIKYIQGN